MNRQLSPFAQLTGAEKQIRWLEYQSIRLPYVETAAIETDNSQNVSHKAAAQKDIQDQNEKASFAATDSRPQPPPEVPRTMPLESTSKHRQYDAVIARLKQAELQSRRNVSQTVK